MQILAGEEVLTATLQTFGKPGGSTLVFSKHKLQSERELDSSPDGRFLESASRLQPRALAEKLINGTAVPLRF